MEAAYDGRRIVGIELHRRRPVLVRMTDGFAAMTRFFSVGTLYEGAAAKALDGADISFFVGLPVAGLLYYAFTRSVDVAAETRVAEAEAAELERAAAQHRTS